MANNQINKVSMTKIKNIIFDLGGVFININYSATRSEFIELGIKNFDELYQQDFVSTLFENLEIGKVCEIEFYNEFRNISNSNLTNEQIKKAWNAMLGKFWIDRLEFAKSLKENYKVYLLSNTNVIHSDAFISEFQSEYHDDDLDSYFHKTYYSHKIGLRKPHSNCFLKIVEENKLEATETLFIDDTLKNIEGAQKIGLKILHLKSEMSFLESVSMILNISS